ncbi:MAG: hypothetical protein DA408_19770 [Bacteroidetes bacterium]|nr:MAG: hypothetical protein C7N36_15155 [Bacteroidota bacterium]PTM08825.1 MAG: hypothetical protein DA408_19770 [Bacteroidota bacterium]
MATAPPSATTTFTAPSWNTAKPTGLTERPGILWPEALEVGGGRPEIGSNSRWRGGNGRGGNGRGGNGRGGNGRGGNV